jgi:hypothetical protein
MGRVVGAGDGTGPDSDVTLTGRLKKEMAR